MRRLTAACLAILATSGAAFGADGFTIRDAIIQTVKSNPGVGEAAANRRATETELRQTQGTLLPQVRVEGRIGPEKFNDRDLIAPPQGNNTWLNGRSGSVVVRQLLWDGFTSINEIWRQTARVDAAAARTRERSELLALDAAEAYVNVVRYMRLIALAQENVQAHRRIYENVNSRFQGGRAGEGDLQQARERVAAAEAAFAEFKRTLDESRAAFRKTVGIEPYNLRTPHLLPGMPRSKDDALAVTLRHNPTIQAAQSDRDAAKYAFHGTAGAFSPTVALEGRALHGQDSDQIFGRRDELSGKVVISWDVFRGGQDLWKRAEMGERYMESSMRHARLQRDAFESIDKAWAARTLTGERISALTRQIDADRKVIVAYGKEYELGQRSLIDLLNAQNQLFNGLVSLESTRSVAIFADYQLLAAMGQLLSYLKTTHPIDAEPLEVKPFGLIPTKLPPIWVNLPKPSHSEPLNIGNKVPYDGSSGPNPYVVPQAGQAFASYWPTNSLTLDSQTPARWMMQLPPEITRPAENRSALSYAAEVMSVPASTASKAKN